ncbi:MAG: GGDEF domain-containing protein [Proteobacteria bacterium]|nr:MAG: GGDEF domain-containing protein [Pseudomonadota bacterium]
MSGGFEPEQILRSIAGIDALLLALALLHFAISPAAVARPSLYLAACLGYAVLVAVMQFATPLRDRPRVRLLVEAVAMVVFISFALALSGGGHGSLAGFYLLPLITVALTLGPGLTAGMAGLVGFAALLTLLIEATPLLLVAMLTSRLAAGVAAAREQLQVMADRDQLTGLLKLQAFTQLVEEERERAIARGSGFALLLVDIDNLKLLNARHGHEAGDRVLAAVAEALRRSSRSVDLVARYGGDEFVLFISGAGPAVARAVANRIRHNVGTTTVEIGGALQRVTVGIGAGVFPTDGRSLLDLSNAAGRALAKDKEGRRPPDRGVATLRAGAAGA